MKNLLPLLLVMVCNFLQAQITYQDAFPNLTFNYPVEIQNAGLPDDDRLFIVEQGGKIRVLQNQTNATFSNLFLDISNKVSFNPGEEKGLLGLAFHPNYNQNGYFYVFYTGTNGGLLEMIVERYTVNQNNPNQANPNSACKVLSFVKNQFNSNHNGGSILFGSDGYLYISVGDGGGAGDPQGNGQNTNTFFGSVLRIDINTTCPGYSIPSSNPFAFSAGSPEIYAWGLRNTWKISYDAQTNRIWGGDVGQGQFEEINIIENGRNYGWNRFEAFNTYNFSAPNPSNHAVPTYFYNHSQGDRSITGGYVYRGSAVTNNALSGKYVFADFVSGRVWSLDYNAQTGATSRTFLFRAQFSWGGAIPISSFGKDINNELYFAGYGSSGKIYKLINGESTGGSTVNVNGVGNFCNANLRTSGAVNAIESDGNGNVYIGGQFISVENTSAFNIARWNGNNWTNLGNGINGTVNAITTTSNGDVYIGGSFTQIGGVSANHIARWNGSSWQALGNGTNGTVLSLETDNFDQVYAGGTFTNVNGFPANNIAKWNGTWSNLVDAQTGVIGTNNEIRSIDFDENNIMYVGGNFGSAGGKTASRIATWDGSLWGTLGSGTSGFVQAIAISPTYVYVGGNFTIAGGTTVNRVARWNRFSFQWETIENGLSGNVNALHWDGNYLYAAGSFSSALNTGGQSNIVVNSLVRWNNGAGWDAMGPGTNVGVDNLINAIEAHNGQLYIGGIFNTAGVNDNRNIALWDANDCTTNNCSNQGGDSDGDGVCNNQDCQPNNPSFPATPGSSCNDFNQNTVNDVITSDGCSCQGTTSSAGCSVSTGNCSITISGLNSGNIAKVFDANFQEIWACSPWNNNPCNATEIFTDLDNGTYYVEACGTGLVPYSIIGCGQVDPCAGQGGDSDGDGICDNQDCQPTNASLPTSPGTPCNDFNSSTINDVITADGCSCQGTSTNAGCTVTTGNCSISITGANTGTYAKVFDAAYQEIWACTPWNNNPCNAIETITDLDIGTYYVESCGSGLVQYSVSECGQTNSSCTVSTDNCSITITGANNGTYAKVFDAAYQEIWACAPWNNNPCNATETVNNLSTGTYYVESCGSGLVQYTVNDCGQTNTGCTVSTGNCSITISGANNGTYAKVFNAAYQEVWACSPWNNNPCNATETINNLSNGTYYVESCGSGLVQYSISTCNQNLIIDGLKTLEAKAAFGQKTDLKWYIAQKEAPQIKQYLIQHKTSADFLFKDIAGIDATDLVGIEQYSYTHHQAAIGDNYYRIKITFDDGEIEYTTVEIVRFYEKSASISISPNPADDLLNIDLSDFEEIPVRCFISKINGEKIASYDFDKTHHAIEAINLVNYQNGIYLIYLQPEGHKEVTQQFVIMKDY